MAARTMKPTHPGEILREDVLPALGIGVAAFAAALGVSRVTVSAVLHERRSVSVEMAIRLGKVLGNSAAVWVNLQAAYDLARATERVDVSRLHKLEPV